MTTFFGQNDPKGQNEPNRIFTPNGIGARYLAWFNGTTICKHNFLQTACEASPVKPMLPKAISKYQWAILQTRCQHVEAEIGGLCWVIVITCICWEQTEPQKMRKTSSKNANRDFSLESYLFLEFFSVPGSMLSRLIDFLLLRFSASLIFYLSAYIASLLFLLHLLLCFSAFCFSCFSAFPAFLLFCFLLFLLLCFSASLLLYFCAFLLLLFNLFFSSVMCFCCSTSCSLLLCFLLSLCFSFSFALFCSACIPNETLERP